MVGAASPAFRPEDLARWRGRTLGAITEAVELDLVFDLAGPVAGLSVLDAGCGDGTYAVAAAARGGSVTAVDFSLEMLEATGRRAAEHSLELDCEQADVAALPHESASFDRVLAVTVLCFLQNEVASRVIRELARVLRPTGRLVLAELAPGSAWAASRRVRAWLGRAPAWKLARFRSPRELRSLVASAGLEVERVEGAVYYPPIALLARLAAPLEPLVRRITTLGAAFVAVSASKPETREADGI